MGRLLIKAAILSTTMLSILLSAGIPARANQAPVKYVNGAGFGNLLGTERGFAYVGYGALRPSWQTATQNAVIDWRSRTQAMVGKDGVNLAPNGASVQIDVVETGYSSIFDSQYGNTCGAELANRSAYYAWTDALTINHTGVSDTNGNGWWDPSELTKPFGIVRICLNAGKPPES